MRRSFWAWGDPDVAVSGAELSALADSVRPLLGGVSPTAAPLPDRRSFETAVPPARLRADRGPRGLLDTSPSARLPLACGQGFLDVVRAFEGTYPRPPDAVARPTTEMDVVAVLEHAADVGAVVVPVGGATSVVGGIEVGDDDQRPVIALSLEGLSGLADLDVASGAAYLRGGTAGPDVDAALRPHGLTLRFFPQSYERSTVGGWVATRAGGHFATGPTHVDDLVEAVDAVTPSGTWTSRRLPASGAGPSPDRLLLGSEGAFGVVTGAWLRVRPRPLHRASATLHVPDTATGLAVVRALARSGLWPAGLRFLDPVEALVNGAGDGTHGVVTLALEHAELPQGGAVATALDVARDHGATVASGPDLVDGDARGRASGGSGAWRTAFLRAPYRRDALVRLGCVVETYETVITWDRAEQLCAALRERTQAAVDEVCGGGVVGLRTTHAYPDGVAPYVTVVAPGVAGSRASQWLAIKEAAMAVIADLGATVTHHHAVGRWHRDAHADQVHGAPRRALRAIKRELDPDRLLNPGVLGL